MLNAFRLITLKDRHPYSLSEGEKRRLAVASVMMLLTDQFYYLMSRHLGQDKASLRLMVKAIQEQNFKKKRTVITVTHDREAATALGQRIFLLSEGRLTELKNESAFSEYFANYCMEKPIQADPPIARTILLQLFRLALIWFPRYTRDRQSPIAKIEQTGH